MSRGTENFLSSAALPMTEMTTASISRESMIRAGETIQQRVEEFKGKARSLYYAVMLFQQECISCGNADLIMKVDGRCQCRTCGAEFDPTVNFQTCPDCDRAVVLKIHHYWCPHCRRPVRSMFCFDQRIFDAAYFRDMMRESRDRKQAEVEKLRERLLAARSMPFYPDEEPVIECPKQFAQDLGKFLASSTTTADIKNHPPRPFFDIKAYRNHILNRVQGCVVEFEGISAVVDDPQLDRVYRFITAVFMDHEGVLEIEQRHDGRIRLVGT